MIVFVVGTGTEVGKTTFTTSWLRALRASGIDAVGWKPVETGADDDQRALAAASGRSLPARHAYPTPVSPHRSARLAGARIDLQALAAEARTLASGCEVLVVETAGGLFSPLDDEGGTNAELVRAIDGSKTILVAANRLGVLHDVEACVRGAGAGGWALDVVVANTMLELLDDESVATNVEDLRARTRAPVLAFDGELDEATARALTALVR